MNEISFRVPISACAPSKNSRQLTRTKGGKLKSLPNTRARRGRREIQGRAHLELCALGIKAEGPVFGDQDVAVRIVHLVDEDVVEVNVVGLGSVDQRGRERDLDNLASPILDALNELLYDDDSQVRMFQVERR